MAATHTILSVASLPFQHKKPKSTFSGSLSFKPNIQNSSKIYCTSLETRDGDVSSPSPSSSLIFLKKLPDWNKIFSPIEIFEANKPTQTHDNFNDTLIGRFVENGLVFRQNFSIRSYEVGAGGKISLEALMNHLQEAGINHMKLTGLVGDGVGSTPEMAKRKLIWVATKVQLIIDSYPTWGDDVVIDNWNAPSGKNRMRRYSVIRNSKTGQTLIRASSNWVIMNKETRRLSRIPEEVREEMNPFLMDSAPIIEDDLNKLPKLDEKTSDCIVTGLKPRWGDLDTNQHVNNSKYINWVLESAPSIILEKYEISRVTMEYKRECHRDNELESLTKVCSGGVYNAINFGNIECNHTLKLANGAEVMKARSEWRPRKA